MLHPDFNMDVTSFLVDHLGKPSTTDASTAKCLVARKFSFTIFPFIDSDLQCRMYSM
jgi:hypothetical protein